MSARGLSVLVFVTTVLVTPAPAAAQEPRDAGCAEWHECRAMALAAAERADFQAFHDLAWRAVQTGPPKDPALMYLLARAQALSGRPHDALVMLDRLAQMGVATDAATNDDFARTREQPGWPELAARIDATTHSALPLAAATAPPSATNVPSLPPNPPSSSRRRRSRAAPPPDPAAATRAHETAAGALAAAAPSATATAPVEPARSAVAATSPFTPLPISEAVRFSTPPLSVGGLAYDGVSQRFVFGDRLGRKLVVVSEGSSHANDLVRGDSAGFQDISALDVDSRRGDLWVASTAADGSGTLHKLQTVSGRPLKSYGLPGGKDGVVLADLSITPAGTVLMLDSANRRILLLHRGEDAIKSVVRMKTDEPTSVTATGDEFVAYVGRRDGISRVDLRSRAVTRVTIPGGTMLGQLDRIRWHRNALIVVAADDDGSRRITRMELNATGRGVTKATPLHASLPVHARTWVTISGDDLLYMDAAADQPSTELITYRIRLR